MPAIDVSISLPPLVLQVLPGLWAVCKLSADAPIPEWAANATGPLVSITRTSDELSLVVPEALVPPPGESLHVESDWSVFRVAGPLEFDLVGILACLTAALAQANVPVFALSTFDTDYLLVKSVHLPQTINALRALGFTVTEVESH